MAERLTHIGSYRIERELSRDERHIVLQGWQTSLNRPVQITQLTPEAAADDGFVARWKQVARDLRDPGHPQLPRILDAQFGGEQPYLVENYVIADTLADQLGRSQDLNASLRLFAGLADALAYAHKRGWAHGQLAPDQVRVVDEGTAYVLDLPWQAAQRVKGDAAAMQADTQALAEMFCQLREPVAGPAPELSGWPGEDEQALAAWLAQGEPPETAAVAGQLAPTLAWALSGSFATCDQLAEALRPLQPGVQPSTPSQSESIGGTIMTRPAGAAGKAPTPASQVNPQSPSPAVYPPPPQVVYAPQQPPLAPVPVRSGLRRGPGAVVAGVILVAGLALAAFLLCRTGVLPFCVSCNDGLIAQYVAGARIYVEREAWDDAQRELESAQAECGACGTQPAACGEVAPLMTQTLCVGGVEKLIAEGETFLENGEACLAVGKLEAVATQAETCGADAGLARSFLARNSDGGAYTLCAQERLAMAEAETAAASRDALCSEARALLVKAHDLKPTAPVIGELYTQAERFAAFRESYDAQAWDDAAGALDELEVVAPDGRYCGMVLGDFRFEILFAQGVQQKEQGEPCLAWQTLQAGQAYAQSLEQQGRLGDSSASAEVACQDTWTPTPVPTATPTPTPKPALSVTQDQSTLRAGPGTNYKALDQKAKQGDTFEAVCWSEAQDGTAARWTKIVLSSGQEAWMHQDLVNVTGEPARCTSVPPTATPIPVCWGWTSKVLPTDQITKPLIEVRAVVRDQNDRPMQGVRVHIWAFNTEFRADTGPNGEYLWAGISQPIEWNVCVYNKIACQITPFTDNGQRANIEFRRVQAPCK